MEDEQVLIVQARSVASADEYAEWLQRCENCLVDLRERCLSRRETTSTGALIAIISRTVELTGAKERLRRRFEREGGGHDFEWHPGFFWTELETAFRGRLLTGAVVNVDYVEPLIFLENVRDTVLDRIRDVMGIYDSVKVNTAFNGEFVAGDRIAAKTIWTKNQPLLPLSDLREWYETCVSDVIIASLGEFQERDSGWALSRILNLTINVNRYNPMRVGCYIEIPREIKLKRAVINVRAPDDACFAWAVVAAIYPTQDHPDRCANYPHFSTVLNMEGIEMPVTVHGIGKFERLNDISVNVYVWLTQKERRGWHSLCAPLRLTNRKRDKHVNLLYLSDTRPGCLDGHFVLIKDLSRLVASQLSHRKAKMHICDRCMHYFWSSEKLAAHTVDCGKINECAIVLPKDDDKWLSFLNYGRKERLSFVVYADLECTLEKREEEAGTASASSTTTNTSIIQQHKVYSIGYYVRDTQREDREFYSACRGENCVSWFVEEMRFLAQRAKTILASGVPMPMLTPNQEKEFRDATHCHVCEKPFTPDDSRVHDHCHATGRYRGPAHSKCNLNYKDSCFIPIFFHNLSGYDAHFIIEKVANAFPGGVNLLPITKETYISFTKTVKDTMDDDWRSAVRLRFVDSFKFLGTSLEKLASYLEESDVRITRSEFCTLSWSDFQLLRRKGVFPYEYVDSVDKLSETRLPPREAFYSSLTDSIVSESDYEHALNVWQRFNIQTLGEYSDLYLKIDVLLLADIFEKFRDEGTKSYGLDPAYYYTLPGYTWDAMLKYTRVKFELLTDIDMLLFVERGIRGGLSQCSNRYARANNKYTREHDPSETPSTYLMYFDANNLYGWAMCQSLPYADFKWLEDIASIDFMAVEPDSPVGYIMEVDLEYPASLHDAHADLPFCPTRDKPPGKRQAKLLATLYDKHRYVTYYRNVQQCVRHGLRITKIHRVLEFAQSPWLRGYIELNTQLRTDASNEFEKNLYKLMNNAVFGKTMENVRNRSDVRLVTRWDGRYGAEVLIARPNFHSRSIFREDLVAVELYKLKVKFEKPIYVGMCILDVSKIRMYEFHYEYMAPLYRDKCQVLYTDTDSLIYRIECEDVYEDMKRDIDKFDTSDYALVNAYGMPRANKKVPGLMKDENNGAIMTEFVGLRAKMYALRVDGKSDTKKIKGVKSSVVSKTITFDDYARCLRREIEITRKQSCIRSKLHEVYTVSEMKLALSPYDDKRYVIPDSTDTLPWGHYRVPL